MIFLNDRLVVRDKALISVFDHGFLYGDGIYETLRAYDGVVFMIDEHIDRLFRSAAMIGLQTGKNHDSIKKAVYKTLRANRLKDSVIRITVSRGAGPTGLDPALCREPTFVILANKFRDYPSQYYRKGIKVSVVNTRRNFKEALDPHIKSLNFLNNILAKIEAKQSDAFEGIMLNYRGYLAEGTISNVFFVNDNKLFTPGIRVGILDGITRELILDVAHESGINIKEGAFRKKDLYAATEVFISNTTMEVMPVSDVDDIIISSRAGKITKLIQKAYQKKVADYIKLKR
jgi:branched-chain amino acid aminotransferase